MARTNATNFSGGLQFPMASAATDLFKKEDVQTLALAVDQHDHTAGKGLAPPAGSITSGMIADGTIVAADIANATVTNAKLASDTARANLLTNGGFEIWQRGNGPFTTTTCADRWLIGLQGTDTLSVSRDTANADAKSVACAAVTYTHGTGAGFTGLSQLLKVVDGAQLNGQTFSFSVRVRTSVANAVRLSLAGDVTAAVNSSYHSGGGAYQTLTCTTTLGASDTTLFAAVYFATSSCTAYLDNAMLVVGSVPADYAPMHPADDLARCLRYYEIVGESNFTLQVAGYASAASQNIFGTFRWVRKASTPTVTIVGPWALTNTAAKPAVFGGAGVDAGAFYVSSSAAGQVVAGNNNAGDRITLEANP